MFKKLEEKWNMLRRDIKNKKEKNEVLDMKTTMSNKKILDRINGRVDITKEKISGLEYITIEKIKDET